jgi:hypothetical protein
LGESLALFPTTFNRSIRIEARNERLTSEAGALAGREVLERLRIGQWLTGRLHDPRNPKLITHPLIELLNTSILLRMQGWADQDDADLLRNDPVLRLGVSERRGISPLLSKTPEGQPKPTNPEEPDGLASQPTLSRLVRALSTSENQQTLREGLLLSAARRIRATNRGHRIRHLAIDVDSLPIEVHGHQPGSEHNGHYGARIYHPIVATAAGIGDLLDVQLRKGNAHTAEGGIDFILSLLDRVERELCQVSAVRMDAGFPEEKLLAALENRGTPYVARVRNNRVLDRMALPYLRRPVGRPTAEPRTWCYEMTYRAKEWSRARRVVLVVLERAGEMYLHHFWLITSWPEDEVPGEALLDIYRQRGTAEGLLGEFMDVLDPRLSSSPRSKRHYRGQRLPEPSAACDSFAHNAVILLLNALAYNALHAVRTLMEAATGDGWSLRRVRERVLRIAARVLVHGRRAVIVVAQESATHWRILWSRLSKLRLDEG